MAYSWEAKVLKVKVSYEVELAVYVKLLLLEGFKLTFGLIVNRVGVFLFDAPELVEQGTISIVVANEKAVLFAFQPSLLSWEDTSTSLGINLECLVILGGDVARQFFRLNL